MMDSTTQPHGLGRRALWLAAVLVLTAAQGGCARSGLLTQPVMDTNQTSSAKATEVSPAGDVPDNAVFVLYKNDTGGYQIQYVEGWSVTPQKDGGVAITDIDSAEVVELRALPTGDLMHYVTSTDEAQVKAQTQAYQRTDLKSLTVNQQAVVALIYTGISTPDAVTNKTRPITSQRYYIPGPQHRLAILTLTTPNDVDNVDAFHQMLESFTWQ
ncbi:lipoprotein [soil metagenome]